MYSGHFTEPDLYAQSQLYIVSPASFNLETDDEFSPVFYYEGIVLVQIWATAHLSAIIMNKTDYLNIRCVHMGCKGWNNTDLLAKEITTEFNDGRVACKKIYF